jgi:hypothetical protein
VARLIEDNLQLENVLKELRDKDSFEPSSAGRTPKAFSIVSVGSLQIENSSLEVEVLKERLLHLEECKVIKQTRFDEMVEKEAVLTGQVGLLRSRNEALEARVRMLEGMFEDLHRNGNAGEVSEKKKDREEDTFSIYVNQQTRSVQQGGGKRARCSGALLFPEADDQGLMESCTRIVEIHEDYNLDKLATQQDEHQRAAQEFDLIDGLLQEGVPNTSSFSNIQSNQEADERLRQHPPDSVQLPSQSLVRIKTEHSPQSSESHGSLEQSIIAISVGK